MSTTDRRSPSPEGDEESVSGNLMLTILLVSAAVIAGIYLGFKAPIEPTPSAVTADQVAEEERLARNWATEKLGVRLTGVSCDGKGTCTLMPQSGTPFRADCTGTTCVLAR